MIQIKNSASENIYDPYSVETDFGDTTRTQFVVHNTASVAKGNVKVYIEQSENLGDLDNPGTFEPYIDISDIVSMGSAKALDPNNVGCVKIEFEGTEYLVKRGQGDSRRNGISLGSFTADERKDIYVIVESMSSSNSRRMFINLVAE